MYGIQTVFLEKGSDIWYITKTITAHAQTHTHTIRAHTYRQPAQYETNTHTIHAQHETNTYTIHAHTYRQPAQYETNTHTPYTHTHTDMHAQHENNMSNITNRVTDRQTNSFHSAEKFLPNDFNLTISVNNEVPIINRK